MEKSIIQQFSEDLGLHLESLDLIQENKYCLIYLGKERGEPCIIKKYKGDDKVLVRDEAQALEFYHKIAKDDPELIDSGETLLREEKNLLRIGFIEGQPFSEVLYKARKNPALREMSIHVMGVLGRLLHKMYSITRVPGAETSPFMFEYIHYCSQNLRQLPLLGFLFFRRLVQEAHELCEDLKTSQIVPSFAHGDFVFKNIHVHQGRVGLIDFANANPRSHTLNDVYNLRFALDNMVLPADFKRKLLRAFYEGLGDLHFPEIAHRFYYEYHRRRWLMLKLKGRSPLDRIQAVRGLLTFAKPFSKEVLAQ